MQIGDEMQIVNAINVRIEIWAVVVHLWMDIKGVVENYAILAN